MARQKDLSDFDRGFIIGAGAPVTETAPLAGVSVGTVTELTSVFRSMINTSVHRI